MKQIVTIILILSGLCMTTAHYQEKTISNEEMNVVIAEIWTIEQEDKFVMAMSEYIMEKCQYGEDMEKLNAKERVFYITQTLEMEVNNGGFSQFFWNSSGDFTNEVAAAFYEIGADTTAKICEKAISAFGTDIPADRDERQELLEELESDEIDDVHSECDNVFYAYPDNLTMLNYEYIVANKSYFSE